MSEAQTIFVKDAAGVVVGMASNAHSQWSASGFEQRMLCPGSHVLQRGAPDNANQYAAEGTAAHLVLTWALQDGKPASAYIGRVIHCDPQGRVCEALRRHWSFDVDDDMAGFVQVCIDYVLDVVGEHGVVLVDRRVNYAKFLGVPENEAWGTLDVAVLLPDELVVIDFKYGRGVLVEAGEDAPTSELNELEGTRAHNQKPNAQLACYGLGALAEFGDLGDFERVRLVISQPRVSSKPSEYDLTVKELEAWGLSTARSAVASCMTAAELHPVHVVQGSSHERKGWQGTFLRPGEKQCKFCKAKATCPALRDEVLTTVMAHTPATPEEFADTRVPGPEHIAPTTDEWLDAAYPKLDQIVEWTKAVLGEIERRMLAGNTSFKNCKLVEGKLGNRQWTDVKEVETYLKDTVRLKTEDLYDLTVKSPTQIAKLGPPTDKEGKPKPVKEGTPAPLIGPRQWAKVQALITRAAASKHVAPISDKRPPVTVTPVADDFEPVTTDASDLA